MCAAKGEPRHKNTTRRHGEAVQVTLLFLMLPGVDKDVRTCPNQTLRPRSFIVHRARIVGDSQEALAVLQAPDPDLSNKVVPEEAPQLILGLRRFFRRLPFVAIRRERRRCYATSDKGATRGRDGLRRDCSKPLRQFRETVGYDTP